MPLIVVVEDTLLILLRNILESLRWRVRRGRTIGIRVASGRAIPIRIILRAAGSPVAIGSRAILRALLPRLLAGLLALFPTLALPLLPGGRTRGLWRTRRLARGKGVRALRGTRLRQPRAERQREHTSSELEPYAHAPLHLLIRLIGVVLRLVGHRRREIRQRLKIAEHIVIFQHRHILIDLRFGRGSHRVA